MINASRKALLVDPFLLPHLELVLTVGEIIIYFVAPNYFKEMQKENVYDHLRKDYDE
jgi:hypothetical protein